MTYSSSITIENNEMDGNQSIEEGINSILENTNLEDSNIFIYKHQLIPLYNYRKKFIDTSFQKLKEDGFIRLLRSPSSGTNEIVFVKNIDYVDSFHNLYIKEKLVLINESKKNKEEKEEVNINNPFLLFYNYLLESLKNNDNNSSMSSFRYDDLIKVLCNKSNIMDLKKSGFLLEGAASSSICKVYWFSHPNLSKFTLKMKKSREFIIKYMKRHKNKSISIHNFNVKGAVANATTFPYGKLYHFHDWFGKGLIPTRVSGVERISQMIT